MLSPIVPMRSSSDDDESCTMRFGFSLSHAMRLRCTMRISGAKHCAFGGHGLVTDSMLIAVARKLVWRAVDRERDRRDASAHAQDPGDAGVRGAGFGVAAVARDGVGELRERLRGGCGVGLLERRGAVAAARAEERSGDCSATTSH